MVVKVLQNMGVLPPDVPKDVQMRAYAAKRAVEAQIVADYRRKCALDEAARTRVYE